MLHTGYHRYYEGQPQQDLVRYFCMHPGGRRELVDWMLDKGVRWWGIDCGSGDHPMNTTIRFMRKDLAKAFEKHAGMSLEEFFPPYQYKHKKSGRKVTNNIFPFHNYAMQEGLIHAENVGGDIDKALNTRCIIGAFPWKYEGLKSCPCRIVAFVSAFQAGLWRCGRRVAPAEPADAHPIMEDCPRLASAKRLQEFRPSSSARAAAKPACHTYPRPTEQSSTWRRPVAARRLSSSMNMPATSGPGSRRCGTFPRAPLHHLQPARLSALRHSRRRRPDTPGHARDDVIAVMDALKIDKAHVVGHSMGAATALHVGIHYPDRCLSVTAAGCGYGSSPDPKIVEEGRAASRATGEAFAKEGMAVMARCYADGATRQTHKHKDPRGYAEFVQMLSEHSPLGHALTMLHLQAKRPTLWDMQDDLKKFKPPLLVLVGDEDDWCLEGSVFLKRTVPTAGLVVIPRSGHTITSEEPAAFNAALSDLRQCRSGAVDVASSAANLVQGSTEQWT